MNWRWLIYDYIPPELDMPRSRRRAIRREVRAAAREVRQKSGWRLQVLFLICLFTFVYLLKFVRHQLMPQGLTRRLISFVVFALTAYVLIALIWRARYEKRTYRVLRDHGYDICLECGYLLKGLPDDRDRCPECGHA